MILHLFATTSEQPCEPVATAVANPIAAQSNDSGVAPIKSGKELYEESKKEAAIARAQASIATKKLELVELQKKTKVKEDEIEEKKAELETLKAKLTEANLAFDDATQAIESAPDDEKDAARAKAAKAHANVKSIEAHMTKIGQMQMSRLREEIKKLGDQILEAEIALKNAQTKAAQ